MQVRFQSFFRFIILSGILMAGFASILGSASTSPPTQAEISSAYYGAEPTRDEAQQIVTAYMGQVLTDPYSAVYSNWKGPVKGWYQYGLAQGVARAFGYRVCVDINAKNRMGGYTGSNTYHFVINSGRVIQVVGGGRQGSDGWAEGYKACKTMY